MGHERDFAEASFIRFAQEVNRLHNGGRGVFCRLYGFRERGVGRDGKRVVVPARSTTEIREAIIAELDGELWTAIYTMRVRQSVSYQ